MPKECVWPANPCKSCGARVDQGRLCREHIQRVQATVGTLDCAWPGCPRRAWDRTGTCSFHRLVAWELIANSPEPSLRLGTPKEHSNEWLAGLEHAGTWSEDCRAGRRRPALV